jgi:hypothetical protein
MIPISAQPDEQSLTQTMIRIHGARAIREAEALLNYHASLGDRDGASKWLRIMTQIEFGDLENTGQPRSRPAAKAKHSLAHRL